MMKVHLQFKLNLIFFTLFPKLILDLKLFDTEVNVTTPSTTNPPTVIPTVQGNVIKE